MVSPSLTLTNPVSEVFRRMHPQSACFIHDRENESTFISFIPYSLCISFICSAIFLYSMQTPVRRQFILPQPFFFDVVLIVQIEEKRTENGTSSQFSFSRSHIFSVHFCERFCLNFFTAIIFIFILLNIYATLLP